MNRFTNENVLNVIKGIKKLLITSIIFLAIGVALFVLGTKAIKKDDAEAIDLETLIQSSDKSSQNTYLKILPYAYQFAVADGSTKSYYIVTSDKYFYVAYMEDSYADKYVVNTKDTEITLKGVSKVPSKQIKELAISAYNEDLEESEQISLADYNDYFGDVYIDTTTSLSSAGGYYLFGIISLILFLVVFIIWVVKNTTFKKSLNSLPDNIAYQLDSEMNDSSAFYYKKAKLYLTKNYFINFQNKFCYASYNDVLWIYPYDVYYRGIKTSNSIKIFTKDAKTYTVATVDVVTKSSRDTYDEIWNTFITNNKNILTGYTQENINKANEYKKSLKLYK